jgi:alpha-glucosidase
LNDAFIVARKCLLEDSILGLGEKTGGMNRMGRSFTLWNTDVLSPNASGEFTASRAKEDPRSDSTSTEFDPYYMSIPFFHHLTVLNGDAAGFFIDNGYRGHFEFHHGLQYRFHFAGGQYTEYVFAGPSLKSIVSEYSELTGRMAAPPMWALGYHQCRWHTYTQEMIENLGSLYRKHDIPCDTLWLDIEYMNKYRVFTWNKETFPCVPNMIEGLNEAGFRVVPIVDPGVKFEPGYSVYEDGLKDDVFCKTENGTLYTGQVWPGKTVFPDFVTDRARRWWGKWNAQLIQSGLSGIWNDMNEPATGDIPEYPMRFDGGKASHEKYHNQYALLMAKATRDGILDAQPNLRTFILSRAGFSGIQRYAANWMGDNMSRWDHLWLSMPMALGLGLSGQPFVGADIGGFAESTNPELFVRWMQAAVLTPFCRNHNNAGSKEQYPWSFGETIMKIARQSIELRYRLMPMLYTQFMLSTSDGLPIQRPLVLEYQKDRSARDIEDQFLVGTDLLAAPVYTQGTTARQVYLPEGDWYDWYDDSRHSGPGYLVAQTPMDRIPLYARGGAIIPMWPCAPVSTMGYQPTTIELHVYVPEADGEYLSSLHEDDGLTFNYRDGAFYRTLFKVRRHESALTIEVATTGNGYAEARRDEFSIVFHGPVPTTVRIDDNPASISEGRVQVRNAGKSFFLAGRLS